MAPRYLLDTNICIYIRQNKPSEIRMRFARLQPGDAAISVITFGELLYGAQKSSQTQEALRQLDELVTLVPVLPMAESVAVAYGAIRANLERRGLAIGNNDLWIAAHARAQDLVLVTNNEREFRRVEGIRIENWVK